MRVCRPAGRRGLGYGLGLAIAACVLSRAAQAQDFAIEYVTPGMNQTELQSVLGPPSYIQVKGLRQAWQYCPDRGFRRFVEDLFRQERDPDLYVTVWFESGRVRHMRAYPSRVMGRCEDFLAAFSWEDDISGGAIVGGYGNYRVK